MARVTREIVPYRDGGPFEWRRYADEPAGDVIVAHGLKDETFRTDVDRAFRNLHKSSNLQHGLNADQLDGREGNEYVVMHGGPGGRGPTCNLVCFGPPDPDDPDGPVPVQDSGVPSTAVGTGDVTATGNLTPGVIPVATGAKEIGNSPISVDSEDGGLQMTEDLKLFVDGGVLKVKIGEDVFVVDLTPE